jgi:uncharacterized membrane protein YraQ (UPF0718 family)
MLKGLSPQAALTFMLAAPILNPIVLWSTAVAYRGPDMTRMVLGRSVLGFVVALVVGWIVGRRVEPSALRNSLPGRTRCAHCGEDGNGCGHGNDPHGQEAGTPTIGRFMSQVSQDFIMLGKYLVIGASVAGLLQTFVPQSVISTVAARPLVSILALMALAAMLSLCSESDAFVAASFVQFGLPSQLGFLVLGPMVDAKLGFLYAGAFGQRVMRSLILYVVLATFVGTLALDWVLL